MEDRRRRSVAFEKVAKRMLKYLDNSDDVTVGITELQEQQEILENRYFHSASGPASDERKRPKHFEIFRQGEEELCIALLVRWNGQLKGLVELERRCRNTRQEVQVLSERQDTSKSTMEDKVKLQSRATGRYHDQIFEEKGAVRTEVRRSSTMCAEEARFMEISE